MNIILRIGRWLRQAVISVTPMQGHGHGRQGDPTKLSRRSFLKRGVVLAGAGLAAVAIKALPVDPSVSPYPPPKTDDELLAEEMEAWEQASPPIPDYFPPPVYYPQYGYVLTIASAGNTNDYLWINAAGANSSNR